MTMKFRQDLQPDWTYATALVGDWPDETEASEAYLHACGWQEGDPTVTISVANGAATYRVTGAGEIAGTRKLRCVQWRRDAA